MAIAFPYCSRREGFRGKTFHRMGQAPHRVVSQQEKHRIMLIQEPTNEAEIVRKLTATPIWRRMSVTWRISAIGAVLCAAVLSQQAHGESNRHKWQPVEQIEATAERFLLDRTGVFAGDTSVQAAPLDARHRLAFCDKPLEGFLRSGMEIKARTIVGVRCSGSKPWKVYVPVDVVVTANVLVARQTLIKGQILAATDLSLEQRDVSKVRGGYLSNPEQVIGLRLKTQVIAGKTLKPTMIAADIAIKRGQSVTLTAKSGGFDISMKGTALMDGAVNQRIRVQNTHSGRIVEGIVRSREQVEVLLSTDSHFLSARPKVTPIVADSRYSNNDR